MPKLVSLKDSNKISIEFQCYECNKQFTTSFDNYSKSYGCPNCRARVNTLPLFCHYRDIGCGGRYEICGGTIKKLSDEELSIEEKMAFDSELDISIGARPTDSFHDEIGDIRGSIITYKCDKCGDSFDASYGNSHGLTSGEVRCQIIKCSSCGRFPEIEELPEPDSRADNTQLNLFVEK